MLLVGTAGLEQLDFNIDEQNPSHAMPHINTVTSSCEIDRSIDSKLVYARSSMDAMRSRHVYLCRDSSKTGCAHSGTNKLVPNHDSPQVRRAAFTQTGLCKGGKLSE